MVMGYVVAFVFWVAVFVAVGFALWAYSTVTYLFGWNAPVQSVAFIGLLCALLTLSTVQGWGGSEH